MLQHDTIARLQTERAILRAKNKRLQGVVDSLLTMRRDQPNSYRALIPGHIRGLIERCQPETPATTGGDGTPVQAPPCDTENGAPPCDTDAVSMPAETPLADEIFHEDHQLR